jgi:hypothetical protein
MAEHMDKLNVRKIAVTKAKKGLTLITDITIQKWILRYHMGGQ